MNEMLRNVTEVLNNKEDNTMIDLTEKFYDLIEEGYIYDEDENGLNMSYGEYVAIQEYGLELIEEELTGIYNIIEFLETAKELIDTADDDTRMFFGIELDEDIYIDEEDPLNSYIGYEAIKTIMDKIEFDEYEYAA
jgi:hypothetical protein